MTARLNPLGVYIHVPFCTVKCAYCDFNSFAEIEDQIPAWETALLRELELWVPHVAGRPVPTVFLGGGTPSLLEAASVERILDRVRRDYTLQAAAEITLEANPESVDPDRMRGYRAAGVNRISMGVQSLQAEELQFLDRLHSADRAREAFEIVRAAGFDNVNTDLIYGLPDQTLSSWQESLNGVLQWGPDHLSCYALTVEEGTPLAARVARGEVIEADADLVADMAAWTEARLAAAGYQQYEISNFALPDHECRHNLVYWRHQEYVGVGPGAHGFVDGRRYAVERAPMRYVAALNDEAAGTFPDPAAVDFETVSPELAAADTLTLGLRLNEGIDLTALETAQPEAAALLARVNAWAEPTGLTEQIGDRVRLTERGRRLANEVLVRIVEPSLLGAPAAP